MEKLNFKTIEELSKEVALRLRRVRKIRKISQKDLALRSNVSLASIKRWEEDGEISFKSFIKIVRTLDLEGEIENLFAKNIYRNIDEVIAENGK